MPQPTNNSKHHKHQQHRVHNVTWILVMDRIQEYQVTLVNPNINYVVSNRHTKTFILNVKLELLTFDLNLEFVYMLDF